MDFVNRQRFLNAYNGGLTPAQFVDMLFANAGVVPTAGERQNAIDAFGGAAQSFDQDLTKMNEALARTCDVVIDVTTLNQHCGLEEERNELNN